jgi:hypothetical protein
MFAIPTIAAFFAFVYLRPHEVFPALRGVSLPGIVMAVMLGYVLDVGLRISRPRMSVLLTLALTFFTLCIITVSIKAPEELGKQTVVLLASLVGFFVTSQAVSSLRALGTVASIILAITLVLAALGVRQGLSSPICYVRGANEITSEGEIVDGRPCTDDESCLEGGKPGLEYLCEKPGPFETHSIEGRVRFRGVLEDPNELAMALAIGLPLALGLYERRRTSARLALALASVALTSACVIFTQSRSGQLAVLAALGVYFLRRFGKRGLFGAAFLAIPLLLLGGRSGSKAQSSSDERLECWHEALDMWRSNPFIGVGQGRFTEHHYLTAHNSFLLALAEMGPLGLFTWTAVLYVAFKGLIRIQIDFKDRPEAGSARTWATALLASLAGLAVSSAFLSVTYHVVVWTFLGLAAGLYGIVRRHAPEWHIRFGLRDLLAIAGIDVALVIFLTLYLRFKGV